MASSTQKTVKRTQKKHKKMGKKRKRRNNSLGSTPKFPIHEK